VRRATLVDRFARLEMSAHAARARRNAVQAGCLACDTV